MNFIEALKLVSQGATVSNSICTLNNDLRLNKELSYYMGLTHLEATPITFEVLKTLGRARYKGKVVLRGEGMWYSDEGCINTTESFDDIVDINNWSWV